ncbi:MAG: hypothetical protein RIG77_20980 [Cyclobacteriaceae bacterium]
MELRTLASIFLSAILLVYGRTAHSQDVSTIQEYQSVSNSLADLNINLTSDSTFKFSMRILGTEEDIEEQLYFFGTWNEEPEYYELTFREKRPILKALFDLQYAEPDEFILRNDSVVSLNKSKDAIMIWGISCRKNL